MAARNPHQILPNPQWHPHRREYKFLVNHVLLQLHDGSMKRIIIFDIR